MFVLGDPQDEGRRSVSRCVPMTCPFQYQVFLNRYALLPRPADALRRDLDAVPQRGLRRDARTYPGAAVYHFRRTPYVSAREQLEEEFKRLLGACEIYAQNAVGLDEDVSYRFSQLGLQTITTTNISASPEQWDEAAGRHDKVSLTICRCLIPMASTRRRSMARSSTSRSKTCTAKEDTLITIQIDHVAGGAVSIWTISTRTARESASLHHPPHLDGLLRAHARAVA